MTFSLASATLRCHIADIPLVTNVRVQLVNSHGELVEQLSCEDDMVTIQAYCSTQTETETEIEIETPYALTSTDCLQLCMTVSGKEKCVKDYYGAPQLLDEGRVCAWVPLMAQRDGEEAAENAGVDAFSSVIIPVGALSFSVKYTNSVMNARLPEDVREVR